MESEALGSKTVLDLENYTIRKSAAWFSSVDEDEIDNYILCCDELRNILVEESVNSEREELLRILKVIFLSTVCNDQGFVTDNIPEANIPVINTSANIIDYLLSQFTILIYRVFVDGELDLDKMSDVISSLKFEQGDITDVIENGTLSEEDGFQIESLMSLISSVTNMISFIKSGGSLDARVSSKTGVMHAVLCSKGLELENTMMFAEAAVHEVVNRFIEIHEEKMETIITAPINTSIDPKLLN